MNKIYWWTVKDSEYKDIDFLIDLVKSEKHRFCYFEIFSESRECVISNITDYPKLEHESNTEEVLIRNFYYKAKGNSYSAFYYCENWIKCNINNIVNIKEITADEYNAF